MDQINSEASPVVLRKRSLQGGILLLSGFGIICAIFLYVYNEEGEHAPDIPFPVTITSLILNIISVLFATTIHLTTTFNGEHSEGVNGIRLMLFLVFFLAAVVADIGGFITRMTHKDELMMVLAASNVCEATLICLVLATAARFKMQKTLNETFYALGCAYLLLFNLLAAYIAIHGLFEFEFTFPALQIVLKGLYIGFRTQIVAITISLLTSTLGSKNDLQAGISSHGGVICKNLHPQQLYCTTVGALIGMIIGTIYCVYGINKNRWSAIITVGAVLGISLGMAVPWKIRRIASIHFDWEHMLVFGCFYAGKMVGFIFQIANGTFNAELIAIVLNAFENSLQIVVIVFLMSSKKLTLVTSGGNQALRSAKTCNFLQDTIVWIGIGYFILINAVYTIAVVLREYNEPSAGRILQSLVSACIFDFRLHACLMWCWIWRVIHFNDCKCAEPHVQEGEIHHKHAEGMNPEIHHEQLEGEMNPEFRHEDEEIQVDLLGSARR